MSEHDIPGSWVWVKLGDVCETSSGGTPLKSKKEYYLKGAIPWLKSGEVNQGVIYSSEEKITQEGMNNSSAKMFPVNTVLVAMYGATAGKVGLLKFESTTNQAICGILPHGEFDSDFMYRYLGYKSNELAKKGIGGAQPNISQAIIKNILIPILPFCEQTRIVQKIESCFDKVEQTEKHLSDIEDHIKKYRESLLSKAFRGELIPQDPDDEPASVLLEKIRKEREKDQKGKKKKQELKPIDESEKPFDIPGSWVWVKLGDVCETSSGGTPLKSKKEYYLKGAIPWLKSGEVNQGVIYSSEEKITQEGMNNSSAKMFPVNTVLVAMYGATAGKVGLLKFESTTNQAICGILPHGEFDSDFMYRYLGYKSNELAKKGIGGAQPNISQAIIKNILIPILPFCEQTRIVQKLESCFAKLDALEELVKEKKGILSNLKESILSNAFKGKLVEQRPEEGTGHELLEKILAAKATQEKATVKKKRKRK